MHDRLGAEDADLIGLLDEQHAIGEQRQKRRLDGGVALGEIGRRPCDPGAQRLRALQAARAARLLPPWPINRQPLFDATLARLVRAKDFRR